MRKLVYGVGINDADYEVNKRVNGRKTYCQFYNRWVGMLKRCYSQFQLERNPTYVGCSVSSEWLKFSNFKSWMEGQHWQGKHLDKDLLIVGNKVYSPSNCVFVDAMTNTFTVEHNADRGQWPIGVYFSKNNGKFRASCSNPFTKKYEKLGCFTNPHDAYLAWRKRKHELACQLADLQPDRRVAEALRTRYL